MSKDQISFNDAERVIKTHGDQFSRSGVIGVGISERDDGIKFVVAVENERVYDTMQAEYQGQSIGGFPICVEIAEIVSGGGMVAGGLCDGYTHSSESVVRFFFDRPGLIVIGAILLTIGVFLVIR